MNASQSRVSLKMKSDEKQHFNKFGFNQEYS
jgi:hypothetical protein